MFHGSINVPSSLMDYSLSPKLSHWYPIFHPLKSIHFIIILFKQNPYESLLFIVKNLLDQWKLKPYFYISIHHIPIPVYFYSSHPRTFFSSVPGPGRWWCSTAPQIILEGTNPSWTRRWNESRTNWAWKICGIVIWYSRYGLIWYSYIWKIYLWINIVIWYS